MDPYAVLRYVSYTAVGKTPNLALFWSVSRGFNGVHTTNSRNGKPESNQDPYVHKNLYIVPYVPSIFGPHYYACSSPFRVKYGIIPKFSTHRNIASKMFRPPSPIPGLASPLFSCRHRTKSSMYQMSKSYPVRYFLLIKSHRALFSFDIQHLPKSYPVRANFLVVCR